MATYILVSEGRGAEPLCLAGFDCATVWRSPYARLFGLPVSLYGAGAYLLLLLNALRPRVAGSRLPAPSLVALFLSAIGAAFSAYLTWASVVVLRAACPWCLLSAGLMAALFGVSLRWAWRESG